METAMWVQQDGEWPIPQSASQPMFPSKYTADRLSCNIQAGYEWAPRAFLQAPFCDLFMDTPVCKSFTE